MDIIKHKVNKLEKVKNAWPWPPGVSAIEVDTWVTSDKKIVLSHNEEAFDDKGRKISIRKYPYKQIYDEDGNKLTLLSNALDGFNSNEERKIFIEVKCGIEIITPLGELLEKYKDRSKGIKIIGFIDNEKNKNKMSMIAEEFEKFDVYALFGRKAEGKGDFYKLKRMSGDKDRVKYIIDKANEIKSRGIIVRFRFASDFLFKKARIEGLKRYVWKISSTTHIPRLISQNVDGVITDKATEFIATMDNLP